MNDERKAMLLGYGLIVVVLAALVGFCAGGSNDANSEFPDKAVNADARPDAASPSEIELAKNEARKVFNIIPLPKGVDSPPITGACSDTVCATNQVQFAEADWPAAWQGDYKAQRNVAFCLITGCDGAVLIDKSAGCAWRAVILEMNSGAASDGDASNMETECGDLTPVQRRLAITKAEKIAAKIESLIL